MVDATIVHLGVTSSMVCVQVDDTSAPHAVGMHRRRWWHRYLDLFVMEMHRPDGSAYLVSINSTGFGECWLPIEIIEIVERREADVPVTT